MKLYDHQARIIDDDPLKTGLWLGTGSGKTRVALLLARGKTLVICPKTQKEDRNWEREAAAINFKGELTVYSKETFKKYSFYLPTFDTVIIDEAHTALGITPSIRTRKRVAVPKASQLFELLDNYLQQHPPARLYLCTATIVRSPLTVWAAAKLLGKHSGSMQEFYNFRYEFYTKLPMPGREVWVPKNTPAAKDALAKMVREMGYSGRLEDFFDVPDQTFRTDYIDLTAEQKERMCSLSTEFPEPIVRIGKRHQVEQGTLAGDEYSPGETFKNAKIDRLLEYALEFPRMVIFAKYRAQIEQISAAMVKAFPTRPVFVLTGDTQDRGVLLKHANAASEGIFIAQAQISAGWELPEYPVMVFASRTYSFVDYDQALGRIQRANNIKKNLYINLVVRGGVDEAVDKSLLNKQDFQERVYAGV